MGRKRELSNPMESIGWTDGTPALEELLKESGTASVRGINQGFEAEVTRIDTDRGSFVLKRWNKDSKPDVGFQYRLLTALSERGIAVPETLGWGSDVNGDQALLTAYGGEPVAKPNAGTMTTLAGVLSAIHRIPVEALGGVKLPKHNMAAYFFPGVEAHPDLEQALRQLIARIPGTNDRLIHGDYHLQNIVGRNGKYAIIDWTNGQAGDYRYDFAWALVLGRIYVSEKLASAFGDAYLKENPIPPEELRLFEGIACLRWMLLHRRGGVPLAARTLQQVRRIVAALDGIVPEELLDSDGNRSLHR